MERIHSLLRKIQDIYYKKEEKQVIDIDLMLDYTRVLYADLLDARTDILAKQGMGLHLKDQTIAAAPVETKEEIVAYANDEQELLHGTLPKDNEDILEEEPAQISPETEIEEIGAEQQSLADAALEHIEEVLNTTESKPEAIPEQEEPQLNLEEEEVPASIEEVQEFAAEQIIETEPTERSQLVINDDDFPSLSNDIKVEEEPSVFSEIHFELPEVKDKASESPKQGFLFQKQKDIRSFIGINDKYQFMNELFANNRTAYEESLDQLSAMEDFAAAALWLQETALPKYGWAKDDETFQSLLQTAKKFFEA